MSALPGRVVWDPADVEDWLQRLAAAVVSVHAVRPDSSLSEWFPYQPTEDLVPPPWTAHPGAWERALDLYANRPPQEARRVFLHRDFHPGNVLWSRHRVSGVVDWVSSCVGPPEVDLAHCRYNLAVNAGSMAAADRFLAIWQSMTGSGDYHPYWDLTTIVSVVPAEPSRALDAFAAAAANRLVG
jgi:Ser/Thr protein kinase RdoA (MazF antagonist)